MGPLSDRQRDCGVSQIMNPEAGKLRLFSRWNPDAVAKISVPKGQARITVLAPIGMTQAREHKPIGVDDMIRQMGSKAINQKRWQIDLAVQPVLR